MGISTRTPRRQPTLTNRQDDTMDAAHTARAHGMLTEAQLDRITDGKVTKTDINRAKKILEQAEALFQSVDNDADADYGHSRIASDRVDVAEALLEAISEQYDAQKSGGSTSTPAPAPRPTRTRSHK